MAPIKMGRRQPSSTTRTQSDSQAAWQATMTASIECMQLLLSPSQANSKAWKPVTASQTGGHTASNSVDVSMAGGAAPIDTLSSNLASTSQHRLDDPLATAGPLAVKVHRRSAARSTRDEDVDAHSNGKPSSATLSPPGSSMGSEIYRTVCHVPLSKGQAASAYAWDDLLDAIQRLLATPECRTLYDHMVEESEVVEELDAATRICRTIFRLGWPASHRDAITIAKTYRDGETLIDVATSLPRSPDAPAYLRPAPPYVRSHVNLFAWCMQRTEDQQLKVTAFWSWDLKGAWVGMPTGGLGAQLPKVVTSLLRHVGQDAPRVPFLSQYGGNVEVTSRRFDATRDTIHVEYQVIAEPVGDQSDEEDNALIWSLPVEEGWDMHIDIHSLVGAAAEESPDDPVWSVTATRDSKGADWLSSRLVAKLSHRSGRILSLQSGIRGRISIQRIAASQEVRLRVNDHVCSVEEIEAPERHLGTPTSFAAEESGSISGFSMQSDISSLTSTPVMPSAAASEAGTISRMASPMNGLDPNTSSAAKSVANAKIGRLPPDRSQTLAALIRRNYIYFTSLLQEPEAKWKHRSDTKGVTITQLDSIDPTLVVYRAEATFVGVGVWDILATIGMKSAWDRHAEENVLLEDLGDASKLWWTTNRAAWPVSSRDNVTVETSYKSSSSIHMFSFSTEDQALFPLLPKAESGTIRTQIDLRGWSIESLSPTTVHITLIEQSDPKGWTTKSSATPYAMTNAVASVGDYTIKSGSPPITTRMLGAKTKVVKYDQARASFRLEYELTPEGAVDSAGHVECEIRCDMEMWSSGLDLVVDPPPINVSCLRRHKLSQGGSGLWLTIEHVVASLEDDSAKVTIRKASQGKEKGVVQVNGARIKVDVDEMADDMVAQLKDKKRTKPRRVPLDLVSSPSKAAAATTAGRQGQVTNDALAMTPTVARAGTPDPAAVPVPKSPLETTDVFSDEKPRQPMTCALDVLFLLRRIHAERGPDPATNPAGWSLVSQRNNLYIRRRLMQSISATVHVQRGDKVVEGLTAEDILGAVSNLDCRKLWDDKIESTKLLESFGNGATTSFLTTKASFPFRGRAFHLASMTARSGPSAMTFSGTPTVLFHASASYPERNASFTQASLNPTGLPLGKVLIDGWILETLDPYSSTMNYQIPSTRCTHIVAIDYAGSLPVTVNTMWNSTLPRSIQIVEEYVKHRGSLPLIRSPPICMEVMGDGRDEDRNMIWSLEDDRSARVCTLLSSVFEPTSNLYSVLAKVEPGHLDNSADAADQPRLRKQTLSNASTTVGDVSISSTTSYGSDLASISGDEQRLQQLPKQSSFNSLRSAAAKSRPSVIKTGHRAVRADTVLMDVEVELRHYEAGYEVTVSSEWADDSLTEELSPHARSLSLSAARDDAKVVPISVSCFDLPPSAVLAATLDPSARPRKHLLRLTLPTADIKQHLSPEAKEGDTSGEVSLWYHRLHKRGAIVRLSVRPLQGFDARRPATDNEPSPRSPDIDSQQLAVMHNGEKITVTHVNKTSAMLQRESERKESHAVLKRMPVPSLLRTEAEEKRSSRVMDDRLPILLQHPIASVRDVIRKGDDSVEKVKAAESGAKGGSAGIPAMASTVTPSTSLHDMTDHTTPTAKSVAPKETAATPTMASTMVSTPIMSILNSYPLSRLGASTAVTTAIASGGVFAKTDSTAQAKDRLRVGRGKEGDPAKLSEDGKTSNGQTPEQTKTLDDGMPGNLVLATTETIRRRLSDVRFTLSTLLLVAIIAFLFGSLVRSLLEPADFILVKSWSSAASTTPSSSLSSSGRVQDAARDELRRLFVPSTSTPSDASGAIVKREFKRLLEIKNVFGANRDLIVAVARR